MTGYDGPTLRAVRENLGVPLRRIARQAGMSHGHLSKVERGEHGRPVTPAIVAAYEKVTGVVLADAAALLVEQQKGAPRRGRVWVPGQITDIRRRGFNASVAALTLGGPLGDPYTRLLDATGRPGVPGPPELTDVAQVEQLAGLFTDLDLRFGGGLVSQLAKYVLRWVVGMLDAADMDEAVAARLDGAVARLAGRAAWAALDVDAHEPARALFRLALFCAVRAGDPDLRGHLLADVAAQHSYLGYFEDALQIIRMAEGDERLSPAVRMVVCGVKARAYGGLGKAADCREQVLAAEQAYERVDLNGRGWQAQVCTPAHLTATTGHALAALALQTGNPVDRVESGRRLTAAIMAHDPESHARSVALCAAQLAVLHLADSAGGTVDVEQGAHWAATALDYAETIHSARLLRIVVQVRTLADAYRHDPVLRDVVERVDTLLHHYPAYHDPAGG